MRLSAPPLAPALGGIPLHQKASKERGRDALGPICQLLCFSASFGFRRSFRVQLRPAGCFLEMLGPLTDALVELGSQGFAPQRMEENGALCRTADRAQGLDWVSSLVLPGGRPLGALDDHVEEPGPPAVAFLLELLPEPAGRREVASVLEASPAKVPSCFLPELPDHVQLDALGDIHRDAALGGVDVPDGAVGVSP